MTAWIRPHRRLSPLIRNGSRLAGMAQARVIALGAAASVNAALGVGVATGRAAIAAVAAALPALAVAFGSLAAGKRGILIFAALALEFMGGPLDEGFELPGGVVVHAADIIVLFAVAAWLAARLTAPAASRPRLWRTPVLGLPLALFSGALLVGLARGYDLHEASLVGMPLRLALYAAIATAMTELTPRDAYRGIVAVFYVGTVWQAIVGAYHLGTGTSATAYLELSTGGTRYLGIAVATYLAGALVLALLSLQLDHPLRWRVVHLLVAGLAAFGVTISFTRTVFLALAVIIPVLLFSFARVRRALLPIAPAVAISLAVAALVMPLVSPELVSTLESRVTTQPGVDSSVAWRDQAYRVAMVGVDDQPLLGVGFGRESTFYIDGMPNVIEGDPHNGFIYLLAGGGALALGGFLLLVAVYVRDSVRRLRVARPGEEQVLVIWSVATWFVFMLHAAAEPVLTYPTMILTMWIVMLLPALVRLPAGERG